MWHRHRVSGVTTARWRHQTSRPVSGPEPAPFPSPRSLYPIDSLCASVYSLPMQNTGDTQMTLSHMRSLVAARRLRRQAEGLIGQADFLNAGAYYSQPTAAVRQQYAALTQRAAALNAQADTLDPQRLTIGR
jgi:hypothetical protein